MIGELIIFIALMVYSLVFPEPEYDPYNDERITVVSPATEEAINSEIEYQQ